MKPIFYFLPILLVTMSANAQNYSLEFDGDSNYVRVGDTLAYYELEELTYSFWVKSDYSGRNYMADFTDNPADYDNAGFRTLIGDLGNGSNISIWQWINGEQGSVSLGAGGKIDEWTHVACVLDLMSELADTSYFKMTAYLNGVERDVDEFEVVSSTRASRLINLTPTGPRILGGRFDLQDGRFLGGSMDDFSIHSRVLSSLEIENIVCSGITPNDQNTLLFFQMNEGSGVNLVDSSANNYGAELMGPIYSTDLAPDQSTVSPLADWTYTPASQRLDFWFQNTSSSFDAAIWTWGDGTSDTNANTWNNHIFPAKGMYNVCIEVSTTCAGTDQYCDSVEVDCTVPAATFSYDPNDLVVEVYGDLTDLDSLIWDFGDGSSKSGDTLFHTYTSKGIYTICAYAYNSCGADTICQEYNAVVQSLEELEFMGLELFPNPASTQVRVEFDNQGLSYNLNVYDLRGRMVTKTMNIRESSYEFNVERLLPGTYILQVKGQYKTAFQKLQIN